MFVWAAAQIGDEEWRDFPFVSPLGHQARREAQPFRSQAQPASQASSFRPGWLGLRLGWMAQREERTDGRMDGGKISPFYWTSTPIRGRCPASPMKAGQGNVVRAIDREIVEESVG